MQIKFGGNYYGPQKRGCPLKVTPVKKGFVVRLLTGVSHRRCDRFKEGRIEVFERPIYRGGRPSEEESGKKEESGGNEELGLFKKLIK